MRRALGLAAGLFLGCTAAHHGPGYGSGDPLSRERRPQVFYQVLRSSGTLESKAPAFSAVLPEGYVQADLAMEAPIVAILAKHLPDGETSITVERYEAGGEGAVDAETFARNLSPDAGERKAVHLLGGKSFEVRHGLDFTSYARQIPTRDPHADSLGAAKPPRMGLLDRRRFPEGGDAFRFYRCRKLGAWGFLGDYRALQRKGQGKEYLGRLSPQDRRVLSACFGRVTLSAMDAGSPISRMPKPSGYRLRMMALDERLHGAAKVVERECVHLRAVAGGFLVLRLRAPLEEFQKEHGAFEQFLRSFEPAPAGP